MKVAYVRLYADSNGESHFEDREEDLTLTDFAPPAAPINLSTFRPAAQAGILGADPGWQGDWHPSSARNLFFVVSGEWEIKVSDGETRRFGPGTIMLVEDTTGKGHFSRVIGKTKTICGIVQLSE